MIHRRLLHLFRVGRFDDVYNGKATQRGKAVFPRHSRTFSLNLLRHILGQGFEVLKGSSNACGEMRLRITYVATWHLPCL